MRILFWGTPEFAVPPLLALLGEGFEVTGVVTQPDRPRGRSRSTLAASAVKTSALQHDLPVFQPATPKDTEFQEMVRIMAPDLSVVVAYGHILPRGVIDLPAQGTLNIHASLLPHLRGAAPIQAAILEGARMSGITIMRMVPALDAGPVLHVLSTPVAEDETFGELRDRLSELGALALIEALSLLSVGALEERAQDDARATYAPKVTRESARIDWSRDAHVVGRVIRAYDPVPGAFTTLRDGDVKLFGAAVAGAGCAAAGDVLDVDGNGLLVACGQGAVRVREVQPEGRRRTDALAWARGRGVAVGDRFGAPSDHGG